MMMGPEPIISIRSMSVRLGIHWLQTDLVPIGGHKKRRPSLTTAAVTGGCITQICEERLLWIAVRCQAPWGGRTTYAMSTLHEIEAVAKW